ncbi:MAG: hypothetical protein M1133_04010 [Armatimonadetes bacterium]|nr:hypothetical protein [Armatimonadota bacterium]
MKTGTRRGLMHWNCILCGLFMLSLALMPALASVRRWEADFYASPKGRDSWSGKLPTPNSRRTDGPFASMERGFDAGWNTCRRVRENNVFVPDHVPEFDKTLRIMQDVEKQDGWLGKVDFSLVVQP